MQNPFRRSQDDFGGRDRDRDDRWDARDTRYNEGRTWSEGDGGRTAQAWRGQGQNDRGREMSGGYDQGQQSRGDYGRGMSAPQAGSSYDQYGYGAQGYGSRDMGGGQSQDHRAYDPGARGFLSDYGRGGAYGQSSGDWRQDDQGRGGHDRGQASSWSGGQGRGGDYQSQGYAPGSDIWREQGDDRGRSSHSHHDFEPDYMHWRNQQMSQFDKDYSDWRSERREKFSSDFDNWRRSRPQVKAENPIVGDVSDGGTGDASEAKKS